MTMSAPQEKDTPDPTMHSFQESQSSEKASKEASTQEFEHVQHDENHDAEPAHEGDTSKGQVAWTLRQLITTTSLAMIYVGKKLLQLWFQPL
jgi:hypothetical protein